MLSHEDKRRLNAIEQQMRDDDPEFVRRFQQLGTASTRASRTLWTVVAAVLGVLAALGALVLLIGLLSASIVLILTGCGLIAVTGHELRRIHRWRR